MMKSPSQKGLQIHDMGQQSLEVVENLVIIVICSHQVISLLLMPLKWRKALVKGKM